MVDLSTIQKNIDDIQKNIDAAAARAGRNASDIRLMAVTKTKPAEVVAMLQEAGIRLYGENYPEEVPDKINEFRAEECTLAMIGHLQSRKAKLVADLFDEYHSLDRLDIAEKMESLLAERNKVMPVFIECNVGGEESKSGWTFGTDTLTDEFLKDFETVSAMPHLRVRGLMTLPPLVEDAEVNRKYFIRMRKIAEYLNTNMNARITELSMGTSADYSIAVEEGATMVRIGTALVGPRVYKDRA